MSACVFGLDIKYLGISIAWGASGLPVEKQKGISICSFGSWLFRRVFVKAYHVLFLIFLICDNLNRVPFNTFLKCSLFSHRLFLEAFLVSFQMRCQVESNFALPNAFFFLGLSQMWFRMFECGLIFPWTATSGRTHNLTENESSLISLRYLFVHRVHVNDFHSPIPPFWLIFMWPVLQIRRELRSKNLTRSAYLTRPISRKLLIIWWGPYLLIRGISFWHHVLSCVDNLFCYMSEDTRSVGSFIQLSWRNHL